MKSSTTDQVAGKLHEIKGDLKLKAGQVTNNPNLEAGLAKASKAVMGR